MTLDTSGDGVTPPSMSSFATLSLLSGATYFCVFCFIFPLYKTIFHAAAFVFCFISSAIFAVKQPALHCHSLAILHFATTHNTVSFTIKHNTVCITTQHTTQ